MATVRILLGIVWLTVIGWCGVFGGGVVAISSSRTHVRDLSSLRFLRDDGMEARYQILRIARAELGVKELTGRNDGKRVEEYLAYTGLKKGNPWCASFVSWCFYKAGYGQPRTAWSPAMFPKERIVDPSSRTHVRDLLSMHSSRDLSYRRDDETLKGLVFGIWFPALKRISHCGLVEQVKGSWVTCLEGNTNIDGSRDGDGVYRKMRHRRTIYQYADWIKNNIKTEGDNHDL